MAFADTMTLLQGGGYLIMLLLMILEGPVATVAGAFAASLGYFNIIVVFLLSLLGDFIGDSGLYLLGRHGLHKVILNHAHRVGLTETRRQQIEHMLHSHAGKSLLFLKLTPFAIPGLILSGSSKMHYGKFLAYCTVITLARSVVFTALGFYAGALAQEVLTYLDWGQYIIVALVIVLVIVYFALKKLRITLPQRG
jgi:membrane protein DedA with SNARE-associated domain